MKNFHNQQGFRGGRSTKTPLIDIITFITDEFETGNVITDGFLYFAMAFDCVSHIAYCWSS